MRNISFLYRTGVVVTVICLVSFVVMQQVKGDWFPPAISFSQYGVGPNGWLLSVFLLSVAIAPVFFDKAFGSGKLTTVLLTVGLVGLAVAALVPTDPGGLQQSMQAKIHMAGSAVGLGLIPIGMTRTALATRRVPKVVPLSLFALSTVSLVLLVVAAMGVDTLGVGADKSWTYAQCGVVVVDLTLLVILAVTTRPVSAAKSDDQRRRAPADSDRPGVTEGGSGQ